MMITGYQLYDIPTPNDKKYKYFILNKKLDVFISQNGINISKYAKHLLVNCIFVEKSKRITIHQLLRHPYVRNV